LLWASAVPVYHVIKKGDDECIYDTLERSEFVTMSVFIEDGPELKAKAYIQGPIADSRVTIGSELQRHIQQINRRHDLELREEFTVDMEHFDVGLDDDYDIDDVIDDDAFLRDSYYELDDDDEFRFMIDDAMDEDEKQEILKEKSEYDALSDEEKAKEKEERKETSRREVEEALKERDQKIAERDARRKEREQDKTGKQAHMPDNEEGKPLERTFHIEQPGWYRVCVEAYWNEVVAEFEMRKSSELGQPSSESGHLQSYDRRAMLQEEKRLFHSLDRKNKQNEDGVKEEDLDISRDQIQRLNRLLNEIREMQTHERHRLSIHATTNEHGHSKMVLSSLFETAFYIVVSGFQVWTVRRWFSGAPMLGF